MGVHEIHLPNQGALLNDEWHGTSKDWNFMVESMRPIHEHIEQENSNQGHVFLRYLVNVRSQQKTRNPSKTEDSYKNSNKSSQQTEQRGRQGRSQYLYPDGVFESSVLCVEGTASRRVRRGQKATIQRRYLRRRCTMQRRSMSMSSNEESWRRDEP